MKLPIYMDYHATTPIDPRVLEAMMPTLTHEFGNAASKNHPYGWRGEKLVEAAREQIAAFINAEDPKEIIFTSGATESNNIALKGAFELHRHKGSHIITQPTEHKSVLDPCKYLEKQAIRVTYLHVDEYGRINLRDLKDSVTDATLIISIMFANNEIGTLQPIEEIGKVAKQNGILFHVDAAQAAGKIPIDVQKMGIDILSLSAHKMYGPKGVGVLYVRSKNPRVSLAPVLHGGGHEMGMRSGTLNVPGIVGFGKACEIAMQEMTEEARRTKELRDRLKAGLEKSLDGIYVNGHPTERLPGNLNISFTGLEGEALLMGINEEIAVSTGSACTSKSIEPSYVLKALGFSGERIHNTIRFGLGKYNTAEEVDYVIERVVATVKKLRQFSPLYNAPKRKEDSSAANLS
jgi:cysteine desulfurase